MSSFFDSSGGAGPLDWPRGSKVEPENTNHIIIILYYMYVCTILLHNYSLSLEIHVAVHTNKKGYFCSVF